MVRIACRRLALTASLRGTVRPRGSVQVKKTCLPAALMYREWAQCSRRSLHGARDDRCAQESLHVGDCMYGDCESCTGRGSWTWCLRAGAQLYVVCLHALYSCTPYVYYSSYYCLFGRVSPLSSAAPLCGGATDSVKHMRTEYKSNQYSHHDSHISAIKYNITVERCNKYSTYGHLRLSLYSTVPDTVYKQPSMPMIYQVRQARPGCRSSVRRLSHLSFLRLYSLNSSSHALKARLAAHQLH